jgi:uncharacterized protein YecE (DUF72 family)
MGKKKTPPDTLSLFGDTEPAGKPSIRGNKRPPLPATASDYVLKNGERLRQWASRGIRFGTSSWKYPGWKGMIYNRHYPSQKVFEQECLAEYSELFPTVCADFALYDFPDREKMKILHDQTSDDFTVSLKVTDRITIKRYPNLPRHGKSAGKENPDFLNVELFEDAFLAPLTALQEKCGVIIFEFSTFYPGSGVSCEQFIGMLDRFLGHLPKRYSYAVEIRNKEFLTQDYLAMLAAHGVAHTLNNWTRMPPIIEQIRIAGVLTAGFSVARALLKPGRQYQEAVDMFSPYQEIREENPELRMGLIDAVGRCLADGRALYAYVNNRAEGNSPKTIEAILDILDRYPVEKL